MPRIPVYDSPQVRPQALPSVRMGADTRGALGEPIAQALGQLAETGVRIAQEAKARADAVAVTNAETELQGFINTELTDRERGLLHARGEQAMEASAGVYERLEAKRHELLTERLTSDHQRQLFGLRSSGLLEDTRRRVESHVGAQLRVAEEASLEGRRAVALDAIATSYSDPAERARHVAALEGPIRALAPSADAGEAAVAAWRKQADEAVLNRYIQAGDSEGAQAYFAQAKERLGAHAAKFTRALEELTLATQADTRTAAIISSATDPVYGWVDPAAAIAAIDEEKPGPFRDEIRRRVEHQLRIAESLKKRAGEEKFQEALAVYLESGHLRDRRLAPLKAWMLDPRNDAADLWNKLVVQERAERRADLTASAEARRAQAEANQLALADFRSRWPRERVQLNPHIEYPYATRSTQLQIEEERKRTIQEIEKGDGVRQEEFSRALDAYVVDMGLTRKADELKAKKYKAWMVKWRLDFLSENKREPTIDEIRKAHADATMETVTKRPFFLPDKKERKFEVKPDAGSAGQDAQRPPPPGSPPPPTLDAKERARELQREGKSAKEIADILTREGF